jgi:hypothetical protein
MLSSESKATKYRHILNTMAELYELRAYATTCLNEIYSSHSVTTTENRQFSNWFGLSN